LLVLFAEPPPTPADLHFRLFGIPVRIHPFFWLMAVLFGMRLPPRELLAWVVAVFVSILLHELGHAAAMRSFGLYPWITLHGFGGLTSCDEARAQGTRGGSAWGQILIAAAGPLTGFLLAGLIIGAIVLSGGKAGIVWAGWYGVIPYINTVVGSLPLTSFLRQLLFVNIFWGLINLLPIYPLDGGQIAREIFVTVNYRQGIRWSLLLSTAAATVLAIVGLVQWRDYFVAIFFGYLAYTSYATLQAYLGRGR
jgi:stage IV sporulation protein FB